MKIIFIIIIFTLFLVFLLLIKREKFIGLAEKRIKGSMSNDSIKDIKSLNIYIGGKADNKHLQTGVGYKLACQHASKLRSNKTITANEYSMFLNIANDSCVLEKRNNVIKNMET